MKFAHILTVTVVLLAALALTGCQGETETASGPQPIFGDGTVEQSRVVARIDGEEITEAMLDMRFEELNRQEKTRFAGPEGRRVFLRHMVDEVIRVREAERLQLDLDPLVSRVLIAERRGTMDLAMRAHLIKNQEPTIDDVRAYFELHRDDYRRLGSMHASHIECATRVDAMRAYAELTERNRAFANVAGEMSLNEETRLEGGDMGWFNKSGFIPYIKDSKSFTELIWDFDKGVNLPIEYNGHWHVVNVHEKKYERHQTLDESYDRVIKDLLPQYQRDLVDDWMREARGNTEVEYLAEFRPGHGKSAKELLERAYYAKDPQEKLDLLELLADDYPDSEYADDALFVAGNVALDHWGDRRRASIYFGQLVRRYPESSYRADAQYMLDNMHQPGLVQPKSIDELRRMGEQD